MHDLTRSPDLMQGAGHTGAARARRPVYVDLPPPGNAGCPAGGNIQAWLAAARDGEFERAWRLLTGDNPFPAIHGQVCYHPSENVRQRWTTYEEMAARGPERLPAADGSA